MNKNMKSICAYQNCTAVSPFFTCLFLHSQKTSQMKALKKKMLAVLF